MMGFKWRTSDGRVLDVKDMSTQHLFFAVRMLWNHHCPEELRLTPFRRYRINMSAHDIVVSLAALLDELASRDDIEPRHLEQIRFMVMNSHKLKQVEPDDESDPWIQQRNDLRRPFLEQE